jgi:hypothetical protein
MGNASRWQAHPIGCFFVFETFSLKKTKTTDNFFVFSQQKQKRKGYFQKAHLKNMSLNQNQQKTRLPFFLSSQNPYINFDVVLLLKKMKCFEDY